MSLAIDIDNPLALLGGVLIWRNYFGMLPTQLTHQMLPYTVTANIPINRLFTHEPLPFPCPRTPPLPSNIVNFKPCKLSSSKDLIVGLVIFYLYLLHVHTAGNRLSVPLKTN